MRTLNIHFEDNASDREDRKGTFIHPSVPSGIEVRLDETPGWDIIIDSVNSINPEAIGGMQGAIVNKIMTGSVKDLFMGAFKNTVQPVIHGKMI